jgi:hypothetical protein
MDPQELAEDRAEAKKDDGGPAFPKAELDAWHKAVGGSPGMTLRDYFAAKALAGFLTMSAKEFLADYRTPKSEPLPTAIARLSYEQADAMLKARQK